MKSKLGDIIRQKRTLMKLSQDELADAVGINRVTLSKYERGLVEPTASNLSRIATKLGCTVSDLMGESQPTRPVIRDEDIKFTLFGGDAEITDEQFEEVKRFAQFVKMREEREELGHKR